MHRLLEEYFVDNRYEEVYVNIEELKVYQKNDVVYSIIKCQDNGLTATQLNNILRQLYEGVDAARIHINTNLIFICAADREYISELLAGLDKPKDIKHVIGIVDTSRNMIMMEENADKQWIELCYDISRYLNQLGITATEIDNKNVSVKDDIMKNIKYSAIHIAIINIVIFLIMEFIGYTKREYIIDRFASNWVKVKEMSEWYRGFTHMFLHSDIDHLVGNMLSLCLLGTYLEKLKGRGKFLITYFTSGIIAGLVSMGYNMYLDKEVISIGASGALYGLFGVLIIVLIGMRKKLGKGHVTRLTIYLALCIYAGMATPNIDNAAHIGGLIAGLIIGILI